MVSFIDDTGYSLINWDNMIGAHSGSDSDASEQGWVHWYCSLREHYFFLVIPNEYTRDAFNLYGIRQYFPKNYERLLELILSSNTPDDEELANPSIQDLHREAGELYGLIHARYITTPRGLHLMKHKYDKGCFGKCPRVLCNGCKALPVGLTNELRSRRVRIYCPNCQEAYDPRNISLVDIDGAFFGVSFPHIFLQTYPEVVPKKCPEPFYPRIFGFRIWDRSSIIERKGICGEFGRRAKRELLKARPISKILRNKSRKDAKDANNADDAHNTINTKSLQQVNFETSNINDDLDIHPTMSLNSSSTSLNKADAKNTNILGTANTRLYGFDLAGSEIIPQI
ncbi:casein kinase II regulatory subunit family protein [Cryptosporidium serpentis]